MFNFNKKKNKKMNIPKKQLSYAQNAEDYILATIFGKNTGFYVDVGANDPDEDSVTRFFYEKGWSGINIEPIKKRYMKLADKRPRDVNLCVGVSNQVKTEVFREYLDGGDGLSTFSTNLMKNRQVEFPFKESRVKMTTLAHIFKKHKVKQIDFLKVDVEGLEFEVLDGNDWSKWRPKVIVIENTKGRWLGLMKGVGYEEFFFDGLNRYYIDKKEKSELPTLFMREYNYLYGV